MVTATTTRVRFTYEDYLNAPEDKRYELLDGELIMVPSPTFLHQNTVMELAYRVIGFVKRHDLGVRSSRLWTLCCPTPMLCSPICYSFRASACT